MPGKLPLVCLFLLLSLASFAQQKEEKLVQQSFENYKNAILSDKGEEAVNYVDSRTIRFYEEILELTKNADSAEVNALSLIDKIMVFSVRHRASREDILAFNGAGLLVYAIKEGMVAKNSVANNSIGKVLVDGDYARGQFITNGKKSPIYFDFYKENGQWKIDLTSIFLASTMAIREMVEVSGEAENEFLFRFLEMVTGERPGIQIWDPIN